MFRQHVVKRRRAAGTDSGNGNVVALGLLGGADDHFMGNRIGKENQQIRTPQLLFQRPVFFCKNLCLAAIAFTDTLVLTSHSLIASDTYNAHFTFLSSRFWVLYAKEQVSLN